MRKAKVTEKEKQTARMLKQKYCRLLPYSTWNKRLLERGIYYFNRVISGEIKEIPVNSWLYEKLF